MCSVEPVLPEELKKILMFMLKIPDFSLAPRLCKQAGLDLVSARKDFDPRTLVSGDLRHFDTTVRCAAHYAGATLKVDDFFTDGKRKDIFSEVWPDAEDSTVLLPIEKMNQINAKNYWK